MAAVELDVDRRAGGRAIAPRDQPHFFGDTLDGNLFGRYELFHKTIDHPLAVLAYWEIKPSAGETGKHFQSITD